MKTVDVCGISFQVVESGDLGDVYGKCDPRNAIIKLNANMSQSQKESTLVHEWMHGVHSCNCVEENEHQVSVMATELYRQGFRVKIKNVKG